MLRYLELNNFRGFVDAKLNGLAGVNLITGLNGAGKTSILEAAFLISGAANASLTASLYSFRGETGWLVGGDRPFRSMFRNLDPSISPKVIASTTELLKTSKRFRRELTIQPNYQVRQGAATTTPSTVLTGVTFEFVGPSGRVRSQWGWQGETASAKPTDSRKQGKKTKKALPIQPPLEASPGRKVLLGGKPVDNPDLIQGHFISPYVRELGQQDYEMLTRLIKQRRMQEAIDALRLVNPNLKDLEPLTEQMEQIVYADIGGPHLLPINLLGSGLMNSLRIVLPLLVNDHATIVIDEFEDGLHHTLHGPLLEAVIAVAEERKNQLFITTHSDEFLRRFIEVAKRRQLTDVALYRLGRLNISGSIPRYNLAEAESLLESRIDLR